LSTRAIGAGILLVALACARSAAAEGPTVEELKQRGNQAMQGLKYADAIAAYRAALAMNPSDVALHYNIGRAQQARGDYPAALDELLEFDRKAPPETKSKVPGLGQLIADVKGHVGELRVRCSVTVERAAILVGRTKMADGCTVEPRLIRISVDERVVKVDVKLESDAYQAPAVNVPVVGGAAPVDVTLAAEPRATTGVVRVVTSPSSAIVSVDGRERGNAPLEISLRGGPHTVDVEAEGHQKAHVPFVVEAGSRREVSVTLEKTTPVTKRWWFWTGVGIVAASVATTAVILVVQPERDATPGNIPPGIVRAPLTRF
jgi:hypothetical protein